MTLLVIFHILVCVFLVFVILLQPGKSDGGIGFGSSSQSIFGSKGASNFLTKTTSFCAIVFLVTSFLLTRSRILEYSSSVIKSEAADKPAPTAPVAPVAPSQPGASDAKAPLPLKQEAPAKPAEPAKK